MLRITIVIPTYWSWPGGEPGLPEDSIFDHPTAIDGEGTLSRCLESLKGLAGPGFQVLLITAPVNQRLATRVEKKIETLIAPFRELFPICQFGLSALELVRASLARADLDPQLLSLEAYAQIRNCQLLASVLLDSELIVAVDDDEVLPSSYLVKALESVGRGSGLAGIYLNADGDYHLRPSEQERKQTNKFIRKALLINEQFDACFARPERVVETPLALGGNMIFTPELFHSVAFDPGITRGEDIDYLMNSRLLGYRWFLDKELAITHLPPEASSGDPVNTSAYARLQQDVLRFFYQREKIRASSTMQGVRSLRAEDFGVYPGEFLKDDLEEQALEALQALRPVQADERFFPPPEQMLSRARARAARAGNYVAFNESWKKVLAAVDRDRDLKEAMRRKLGA